MAYGLPLYRTLQLNPGKKHMSSAIGQGWIQKTSLGMLFKPILPTGTRLATYRKFQVPTSFRDTISKESYFEVTVLNLLIIKVASGILTHIKHARK